MVPVSGGGLISGVAVALKTTNPNIKIIGTSMEVSAVMGKSLKAGRPIVLKEEFTLADSLLGGLGFDNKYTFSMVQKYVNEMVLISEAEIAKAIVFMLENHRMVIEGAAGTGIATVMKKGIIEPGSNTTIIVSGNNINFPLLLDVISRNRTLHIRL